MSAWRPFRDPGELAWLQEHQLLARHVCALSALLFGLYGLVDALLIDNALQRTGPWRLAGLLLCAFALVPLRPARMRPWALSYIALAAAAVVALVSLIFLGIVRSPDIALAAQMQCLMMLGVVGNLRSVLCAAFAAMLLSFNAGLWANAVPLGTYVLDNTFLVFGMLVLLMLSSAQRRQYAQFRLATAQLQTKDAQFRTAIESSPEGFCIVDPQGRLLDVNQAYCTLSGYRRESLLGMGAAQLEAEGAQANLGARMAEVMRLGSTTCEMRHRRADGSVWPVQAITTYSPQAGGLFFVFIKDLTERKRTEELIRRQAQFDALTGLPNRTLLFDCLTQECLLATQRKGSMVALLFADLDGFKAVNDQFGHAVGDWVLQEVAQRWQGSVRASDTVARLGGDEFAVVLGGIQNANTADVTAQKLIDALSAPLQMAQGPRVDFLGVSVGIALFPQHADNADALISCADAAMYDCKRQGKNRYAVHRPRQA